MQEMEKMMMNLARKLIDRIRPSSQSHLPQSQLAHKKTWAEAQKYELEHAYGFMQEPFFIDLFAQMNRGELQSSTGYLNELLLSEFFSNSRDDWRSFLESIQGKTCVDIGPCVFSPLPTWDGIGQAIAIEPLGEKIKEWQTKTFGSSIFDTMTLKAVGADIFLPELAGKIDGVIYCRNMLDHTPNWPFVLANISAYAAPGCHLFLWTDIDHRGTADEGHFDICSAQTSIKRMVEQLGFSVRREFNDDRRQELNWGCVATKN
jgi:hypothetical protein